MADLDNNLLREALRALQQRLPPGWRLGEPRSASTQDAVVKLTAPDRSTGSIVVQTRARFEPRDVAALVTAADDARRRGAPVVVARYLSEGTTSRLRDGDVGYLDLTGNVRLVLAEPGLYIETPGASEDPDREKRPARTLRGAKAGRIVRALVDRREPPGVRELAALTNVDAGYVSRVLALLSIEALVTRTGRGRIDTVDWPALLRRWATDAPLDSRAKIRTYLEPRGLATLVRRVGESKTTHAVTGSLAAAAVAPIASPRLAMIWVDDSATAAKRLGLREAEAGANVMLLESGEPGPFERASERDGISYASPSQVAADLLTSPGRGPAEGEELIGWMRKNERRWRT